MIFKSFLLVNFVSVCMKISNSVVLVGLYYGFISAFSMGSSYLFLLRPRFLEEDQDAIEKKVSETAGFFTGQLLIFISILYVPLHLALGRPHTLLLLVAPYFFFHFLCNNSGEYPERLFALEFTNSLRNLRIQWVFLNNVLLQLFSLSLLARPMLTRLSHIYIFQCNNKMLFVLSSFVGWLIGHILVVKWVGLVFVWILKFIRSKRMKYITSNVLIPSINSIREKWRNSFVAGLIREILGMKRVESILVSIKNSKELDDALWWIGSSLLVNDIKLLIRFYVKLVLHGFQNVYMRLKFIEDTEHLFTIVLFAIFLFYLDRTPFFLRDPGDKKLEMYQRIKKGLQVKEMQKRLTRELQVKEREDIEEELQEKQEGFPEEHISPSLLSEERGDPKEIEKREENSKLAILKEEKSFFSFVKPLATPFFDPKKSLRPLRYIKTCAGVEQAVKNETSQYFFYTCRSDGKERICFTYPPSLSTFWEMIQRKMYSAFPRIYDEWRALGWYDPGSYIQWTYSTEQKKNSLNTEFQNRIKTLDKKRSLLNVLQKRKRLGNDTTKKVYLPEISDPFLTGAQRAKIQNFFSSSILNNNTTLIQNDVELSSLKKKNEISPRMIRSSINKLHVLLIPETDYGKLKKKIDIVNTSVIPIKNTKFSLFKSKKVKIDVRSRREGAKKFCKSLLNPILPDPKISRKKAIGVKEITKKVPRWSYKLIDELEQAEGTAEGERMFSDHDLRLLPFKRLAVFNEKDVKKGLWLDEYGNPVRRKRLYTVRFLGDISDFRRGLIKGSPRHDRRKAYVCRLYQVNPRSPLFAFRRRSIFSFFGNIAVQVKFFFEARSIRKKGDKAEKKWLTTLLDNLAEQRKILGLTTTNKKDKADEDLEDEIRIENVMEMWENIDFGQAVRALILLMHIFLRKKIVFPSFIIGKNIARILLLQAPEWSIDFARLKRESYAICTYYGLAVSHKLGYQHLPENWTLDGLQIQVINPFFLQPWYRARSSQKDPNKMEYREIRFLTSFGLLTDRPFGDPITPDWEAFFNPIGKALKKKIIKLEKKHSLILSKRFLNVFKKTKKWVSKSILFLNRELSKRHPIALFVVRESSELTLSQQDDIDNLKNKQDLRMSNQRISESLLQGPVRVLKDDSLPEEKGADSEKELTDLDNQLREIWYHIDKVTKERKKRVLTPEPDSPDKLVQAKKKNLKKFKRIKARLIRQKYYFLRIRKSYYVLLFFIKRISSNIKRIYLNLVRCAISIRKIHPLIFFENSKKMSAKSICKTETHKVYKTNIYKPKTKKKKNLFISIFKEPLSDNDIRISEFDIKLTNIWASNKTKKSKGHLDLSSVSQAYVFYKLYQTQPINLDKLRYVLQYHGTSLFLKKEIKDYFEAKEIFHSKLKHKNILNSGKNQWKNWFWLKAHYQYSVSPILWNSLSHQKWRTKVNQERMDENTDLNKRYSNEKRKKFFEENALDNEENSLDNEANLFGLGTYRGTKDGAIKNSIKSSSYARFSYQSINSEDKYVSPLCINNKQKISYNRRKGNLFDRPEGIALINNFLVQNDLLDLYTFPDRKYLNWRLFPAGLIAFKQKAATAKNWTSANSVDTVKYWTAANDNTSIKPGIFLNWQNDERTKNQSPLFDWLGMNTEIPNNGISDLKGWFFPELIQADLRYQFKPRIIPIELLFVNQEGNENIIQDPIEEAREKFIQNQNAIPNENAIQNIMENFLANKNIKRNTKLEDPYKTMKAIDLPLEKKKEKKGPGDLKPYTPDKLKRPFGEYLKNGDIRSSQVRSPKDADETDYDQLDILKVNGYELNKLKPIKNNKKGIKRTLLTSIKRGRLQMEFSTTQKSLKDIMFTTGLFAIEPLCISRQNEDAEFLIYQMIKIPLGQKIDPYDSDLFVPETILSTKRRRELRILISFYSRNGNLIHKNPVFCKYVKNCGEVVDNSEKKKKKLIKSFLWPNYRLEDLACMNRYWFNTNNGSRLSMLRIHMYPRLKIR